MRSSDIIYFRYYLNLHADLFIAFDINDSNLILHFVEFPIDENGIIQKHLLQTSVTSIILSNYANQVIFFVSLLIILI